MNSRRPGRAEDAGNAGSSADDTRALMALRAEHAKRATTILQGMQAGFAVDFLRSWIGFNAFYNLFYGHNERGVRHNEREALKECIRSCIDEKAAHDILLALSEEIRFLAELPPGDMRLHPSHEAFRRRGIEDMGRVVDTAAPASIRLSHLVSAVYQVRCNLVHGMKGLMGKRDQDLVKVGYKIVGKVLEVLLEVVRPAANPGHQADG